MALWRLDHERVDRRLHGEERSAPVSAELGPAWRAATREVLVHYLSRGYEVRELLRGDRASQYILFSER